MSKDYIMIKGQKVYATLPEIITAALKWHPSNLSFKFKRVTPLSEDPLYVMQTWGGAINQYILDKMKAMGFSIEIEEAKIDDCKICASSVILPHHHGRHEMRNGVKTCAYPEYCIVN